MSNKHTCKNTYKYTLNLHISLSAYVITRKIFPTVLLPNVSLPFFLSKWEKNKIRVHFSKNNDSRRWIFARNINTAEICEPVENSLRNRPDNNFVRRNKFGVMCDASLKTWSSSLTHKKQMESKCHFNSNRCDSLHNDGYSTYIPWRNKWSCKTKCIWGGPSDALLSFVWLFEFKHCELRELRLN